jgi:hypothetical protein
MTILLGSLAPSFMCRCSYFLEYNVYSFVHPLILSNRDKIELMDPGLLQVRFHCFGQHHTFPPSPCFYFPVEVSSVIASHRTNSHIERHL